MAIEQEIKNANPLHKEFQSLLDNDFKDRILVENKVIEAKVIEILKSYVVVDARAKSEAMIPISEFKEEELSKLKVGDTIKCFLERIESNRTGEIVLSYEKAKSLAAWEKCVIAFEKEEELTGVIKSRIKGGFICSLFSGAISAFLPNSHLEIRPVRGAAVDRLMNTPIKVQIVRLDRARGNISCSRRQVLEKSKNAETAEALKEIKEGDIVEARVHACVEWGIFLTYKSLTLLLHVSDLSHGRVKKPADLVSIGDSIKVKITKIDEKTNRVSASVKALTSDPYENIDKKYKVGEIYQGVVTKLMDYGAFCKIEEGVEGLIHNSELDWTNRNIKPSKVLSVSENIKFKIVNIDKASKRVSLSYKATLKNPWDKIKDKVGERIKIKISNVTDKAFFGELEDTGLNCMCHYKELNWSEDVNELKKYKKNDLIDVKITEIKDDKIRVSVRALEKDPLDWFKDNKKKVGDIITTRVHEVLKAAVKVSIDKDKKLIVTIRKNDLAKDSADARPEVFSPGNALDAKITELDLISRKVKLSVKAAQIDEEKSLIAKFGEGASKSGATLAGIFKTAIGKKDKKKK
jgi:small subunit ribosomal protein S1